MIHFMIYLIYLIYFMNMFATSSQKKYWIFDSAVELQELRFEANERYIKGKRAQLASDMPVELFLTPHEEFQLVKMFENVLRDFCRKFNPPMPKAVIATALHYYKRYYLNNSVMDFHPKHILVTCAYLAAKVEEFNVSMATFVSNVKGNRERASTIILNNELVLMQQLKYHLTVHNPYRPVEGWILYFKKNFPTANVDWEALRPEIDTLLDNVFTTDVPLLFPPSQIAIAVVAEAAIRSGLNEIEDYVNEHIFLPKPMGGGESVDVTGGGGGPQATRFWERKSTIMKMVNESKLPTKEAIREIEKKLETCANQANNPSSAEYNQQAQQTPGLPSSLSSQADRATGTTAVPARSPPNSSVVSVTGDYASLLREQDQHDRELIAANAVQRSIKKS